jgi:hypothetical protein
MYAAQLTMAASLVRMSYALRWSPKSGRSPEPLLSSLSDASGLESHHRSPFAQAWGEGIEQHQDLKDGRQFFLRIHVSFF